jgi:hypothetical protein
MHVSTQPADFDGNPGPIQIGVVLPDLTFSLKTWLFDGHVIVSPSATWVVKSVRWNGAEVGTTPLPFAKGTPITGLNIEIARRTLGH